MAVQSTREPAPQPVLSPLTAAAVFLVLTIDPGGEQVVSDLLADLSGLQRPVAFTYFIGYAATPAVTDGLFSQATALPATGLPAHVPPAQAPSAVAAPGDGSLGIGSLKG